MVATPIPQCIGDQNDDKLCELQPAETIRLETLISKPYETKHKNHTNMVSAFYFLRARVFQLVH